MVDNNFLFHREAYDRLRVFLLAEFARPFRFVDIACGDAGARAFCIWLYPYPAFLRYAAHSAGGYWARILPLASEIAS